MVTFTINFKHVFEILVNTNFTLYDKIEIYKAFDMSIQKYNKRMIQIHSL